MHRLIEQAPGNAERIRPYIGGSEVNDSATHVHHRYAINFADRHHRSNAALLDALSGPEGMRAALDAHGKLQLSARLVKGWLGAWDEATIDERAGVLFEEARLIWPAPPTPVAPA